MPDFEIVIQRTIIHTTKLTLKAKDEDAADTKANNLINSTAWEQDGANKEEWELDSEAYEVIEVNEE